MNKTNYTPAQQAVIDTRGNNILVSASAGTGKTTVMIERIYQLIENKEVDVNNLMVVTFTKLAASEMKQRLTAKLSAVHSDHICQQLEDVDNCAISTLHSFCSDLLRTYFYIVGIDPSYSIIDDVMRSLLIQQALDDTLNKYHDSDDEVFFQLFNIFADNRRDTVLREQILSQYEFSTSLVDYSQWYHDTRANYLTMDSQGNVLQQLLIDNIISSCGEVSLAWKEVAELLGSVGLDKHAEACYSNSQLLAVNHRPIQPLLDYIANIELARVPQFTAKIKLTLDDPEQIKGKVDEVKDLTKDLMSNYNEVFGEISYSELFSESKSGVVLTDKLVEIVLAFAERYQQYKRAKGLVDFSDLEHLTLKVLQNQDAREQLQQKYKMIFVDEHQDTNQVQDAIISQLTTGDNLFVVGDVKQSIYAFRGCDPSIFLDQYNSYVDSTKGKAIVLSDNFRSDKDILNFVNIVFSHVMTPKFGQVDYKGSAMLRGSLSCQGIFPAVNIDIVSTNNQAVELDDIYDMTKVTTHSNISQGKVIASRIASIVGSTVQLPNGKSKVIEYGDIAILSRGMTDKARDIYSCLVDNNIPVVADINSATLGKEVRDIVNILRVIDNNNNDIPLIGCCLSPIGGLSEQELAVIHNLTVGHQGSYYTRLCVYMAEHEDSISAKIDKLTQLITKLTLVGHSAPVDEVILTLLTDTQYQLFVNSMPNGQLRTKRLYSFVDSMKGAYHAQSIDKFVRFIDSGASIGGSATSGGNNVTMMTMHSSKGLEFPVVFVVGCETTFNNDKDKLIVNKSVGMAFDHYDFDSRQKRRSLSAFCTQLSSKKQQKEEEMRLLYVALTRAKYNLFIVATGAKLMSVGRSSVLTANNHASWIMSSLASRYDVRDGFLEDNIAVNVIDQDSYIDNALDTNMLCQQSEDLSAVLDDIHYRYPYSGAVNAPSKVVSSLLDVRHLEELERYTTPALEGNTHAEIGTAYHAVLERIQLQCTREDIISSIANLVDIGDITQSIAQQLDVNVLYNAVHNEQLIELAQGKVYREVPFMHNVRYSDVADVDINDTIMLQGIVDMVVVTQDKAVVIDYKYINYSGNVKQKYRRQLESYCLAIRQITGIQHVDSYIMSLKDNKLIKMN